MTLVEENTLGVPVGRKRGERNEASRRLARTYGTPDGSLGTSFLGAGAIIIVAIRAAYGLGWFVMYLPEYPRPLAAVAAWVVLLATCTGAVVVFRSSNERMSHWKFGLFLFGLAGAVSLDLAAIWELHDVGRYATASVTAGMALLLVVTLRRATELLIAAAVLGTALGGAMIASSRLDESTLSQQITTLAFAVLPVVIGAYLFDRFRRIMRLELDRALVQSTVSAPRFAVGMLASEQLARLDLAAEKLLDSVANGQVRLPLSPRTASTAASLATELRLHLIEGRRETWLYHAISESAMLGRAVTLSDPGSLAGLLDPKQRDGLLSAVWLLVSDTRSAAALRSVRLTLGPVDVEHSTPERMRVPIELVTEGMVRGRVDPAVWEALSKVGHYSDSTQDASFKVRIDCDVERPRDVNSPSPA